MTAPAPLSDWHNPGEIMFLRPERCRKCPGRILVAYYFSADGSECGWGTRPIGPCGNPARCGKKPLGCTFDEALGRRAGR
jgi:hypothetical protein